MYQYFQRKGIIFNRCYLCNDCNISCERIEAGAIATLIQALSHHHPSVRNTAIEFDEGTEGTKQFKIRSFKN